MGRGYLMVPEDTASARWKALDRQKNSASPLVSIPPSREVRAADPTPHATVMAKWPRERAHSEAALVREARALVLERDVQPRGGGGLGERIEQPPHEVTHHERSPDGGGGDADGLLGFP